MKDDPSPNSRRQKKTPRSSAGLALGGAELASFKVRDPRMRILTLVGLLILLGIVAVMLKTQAKRTETAAEDEVPSRQIGSDLQPRFTGVPALDTAIADRISDQGPDARRRWPHEAASYLLYESQYRAPVRAYARNLFPLTAATAEQIRADSRPWRFKYVYFRGELESVREENYEEVHGKYAEGPIGQVKRGLVLVDGGAALEPPLRVTFVTDAVLTYTDPNEIEPRVQEITDGWVRVRGIVVKNYLDQRPDGTEVPSLLVVATHVERDFPIRPVNSLDDVGFEIIRDNPAIADTQEGQELLARNFPRPMFRLLKYAEARAGEQGAALREKEKLTPRVIDKPAILEKVIGSPSEHRGEYFGGRGIIALEGYRRGPSDTPPNDAGVEEYFEGYIATDRHKLVRFLAPAPLLHRRWEKRTRIRWAGFFYKSLGYTARGDRSRRLAPFVILTELEEIVPEPADVKGQLMVAIGAVVGLCLLVWLLVREDRTKREFRRTRRPRRVEA